MVKHTLENVSLSDPFMFNGYRRKYSLQVFVRSDSSSLNAKK